MKKISIFFAAIISLACVTVFSSCGKDEIDLTIVDVRTKGTVKFLVRAYSIGTSGTSYTPESIRKNEFTPVEGAKITLANGQVVTTDGNGSATLTLEVGEYIIDKVDIPDGYYWAYNSSSTYDYVTDTSTYTYSLSEEASYLSCFRDHLRVSNGYQEYLIKLYKN